jgi:hypothetical protein
VSVSNDVNSVKETRQYVAQFEERRVRQRAIELAIDAISKCELTEKTSITELAGKFLKFMKGERVAKTAKRRKSK